MVSDSEKDQDYIGFTNQEGEVCFQIFFVRQGKVIGREHFLLEGAEGAEYPELAAIFIKRYYERAVFVPQEILLEGEPEEKELLETWLWQKKGSKVHIKVPRKGKKFQLLEMVAKNAALVLKNKKNEERRREEKRIAALQVLQNELGLSKEPERIECYDISNIQGKNAVGSMVVFKDGKPDKTQYRRFKIKTVSSPDDYAMLQEVLYRRCNPRKDEKEDNKGIGPMPDVMVIDGGKGQLNAVLDILSICGCGHVQVIGLAKRLEEIYIPGKEKPLVLAEDSPALQLLKRIRDEAHRFAVDYHRMLRSKQLIKSKLDAIEGIGPKRKKALLNYFGSVKNIAEAPPDKLVCAPGISRKIALEVWNFFHPGEVLDE